MPRLFGYDIHSTTLGGFAGFFASVLFRVLMDELLFLTAPSEIQNTYAFHRQRAGAQVQGAMFVTPLIGLGLLMGRLRDQNHNQDSRPIDQKATSSARSGLTIGVFLSISIYQYSMHQLHRQANQTPGFEDTAEYQSQRANLYKLSGVMTLTFSVIGALIGLVYAKLTSNPQEDQNQRHIITIGHGHGS